MAENLLSALKINPETASDDVKLEIIKLLLADGCISRSTELHELLGFPGLDEDDEEDNA